MTGQCFEQAWALAHQHEVLTDLYPGVPTEPADG